MEPEQCGRIGGCDVYREIDAAEYQIDADRIRSLQDTWGISMTKEGKVRIPVCYYDDVLPLLTHRRPPGRE
jgi:hypothetical protein